MDITQITGSEIGRDTEFVTAAEAAKILRVTRFSIYRMVWRGDVPAYRIGRTRQIRFKLSEILTLVKASQTSGDALAS